MDEPRIPNARLYWERDSSPRSVFAAGATALWHANAIETCCRGHPLCYQESCLPELLYVLRIRFGRSSTARRARLGVLGIPKRFFPKSHGQSGKPILKSFHEKAGVSQVCFSSLFFLPVVRCLGAEPPLSPSFHPHSFF